MLEQDFVVLYSSTTPGDSYDTLLQDLKDSTSHVDGVVAQASSTLTSQSVNDNTACAASTLSFHLSRVFDPILVSSDTAGQQVG